VCDVDISSWHWRESYTNSNSSTLNWNSRVRQFPGMLHHDHIGACRLHLHAHLSPQRKYIVMSNRFKRLQPTTHPPTTMQRAPITNLLWAVLDCQSLR
jgi:hypothetical protein